MNKSSFLAVFFILGLCSQSGWAIPGDLNGDRLINSLDLRLLQMRRLGMPIRTVNDPDLNGDGQIDASDFIDLARGVVGQTSVFNVRSSNQFPGTLEVIGVNLQLAPMTDLMTINGVPVDLSLATLVTETNRFGQMIGTAIRMPIPATAADGAVVTRFNGQSKIINPVRFPIEVEILGATADEQNNLIVDLQLDHPAIDNITVHVQSTNGTALAGQDYISVNKTVTIPAGQTRRAVAITVIDDFLQENTETLSLTISQPNRQINNQASSENISLGVQSSVVVTIDDNDSPKTLSFLASLRNDGQQVNASSFSVDISAGGRFALFSSTDNSVVSGDNNGVRDIFLRDRLTKLTERVSIGSNGLEANNASLDAKISDNGRFVVFTSFADNIVANDTNSALDVFVYDRQTEQTTLVSRNSSAQPGNAGSFQPAISANGRFIAFVSQATDLIPSDTNNASDVFVYDQQLQTTRRVSVSSAGTEGTGGTSSGQPSISADGRYVLFQSEFNNLVSNDLNSQVDVFRHDCQLNRTTLVSVGLDNNAAGITSFGSNDISADGRYVVFHSQVRNLVAQGSAGFEYVFVRDMSQQQTRIASVNASGALANNSSINAQISADGQWISFQSSASNLVTGDMNSSEDIFLVNQQNNAIQLISKTSSNVSGNGPSILAHLSANGQFISYTSNATDLLMNDTNNTRSDVLVAECTPEKFTHIALNTDGILANDFNTLPQVSHDGRFVVFESSSTNLVANDTNGFSDIFVRDRETGVTVRVSLSSTGVEANNHCFEPKISADGRIIAFFSRATNLVNNDMNGALDAFVHNRETGETKLISLNSMGSQANAESRSLDLSSDGRFVAFSSSASNLVVNDTNGGEDVFVRDLELNTTVRVSIDSSGNQADSNSFAGTLPSISGNGRYIAFISNAPNLVANDINRDIDVFVHDRETGVTSLESVTSANVQNIGISISPSISDDGQFLAYSAIFPNFSPSLANSLNFNLFLRDRRQQTTTLITNGINGIADENTFTCDISANGQWVTFISLATNLVNNDTNQVADAFLFQRDTGHLELLTQTAQGQVADDEAIHSAISGDGQTIVVESFATNLIFAETPLNSKLLVLEKRRAPASTQRVSVDSNGQDGSQGSDFPFLSANGKIVAFSSAADNFVPGDTNTATDIFLHSRNSGRTELGTRNANGILGDQNHLGGSISGDGRYLVFASRSANLVANDTNNDFDIFIKDLQSQQIQRITNGLGNQQSNGPSVDPVISENGRFIAYSSRSSNLVVNDRNSFADIFIYDRLTQQTRFASVNSHGEQGNNMSLSPSISADGRFVAFASTSHNLDPRATTGRQHIYVFDQQLNQLRLLSVNALGVPANGQNLNPKISANGQFVCFQSTADNLVGANSGAFTDLLIVKLTDHSISRISVSSKSQQANAASQNHNISADGRFVVFSSDATNLVPNDTNGRTDVFVRDLVLGITYRVSTGLRGEEFFANSTSPNISANGRTLAFSTDAALIGSDRNGVADIYRLGRRRLR